MIDYERLARAETHPTRLGILELLDKYPELSSLDLCQELESTTAHVVYHLGVLEGKGLIETVREETVGPEVHRWVRLVGGEAS